MSRVLGSLYLGGVAVLSLAFSIYQLGWSTSDSSFALAAGWSFFSGAFAVGWFCFGIIADLKDRVETLRARPVEAMVLLTDVFQSGDGWYASVCIHPATGAFSAPSDEKERVLRKVVSWRGSNLNVFKLASFEPIDENQVRIFGQLYRRADAAFG